MTAREVYLNALTLIGETDDAGAPKSTAEYEGKAVSILNLLMAEIAERTGVSAKITTLSDAVADGHSRALAYGLSAAFAMADRDAELYSVLISNYTSALRVMTFAAEELPAAGRLEAFNRSRMI